jgi:hypothetical protein
MILETGALLTDAGNVGDEAGKRVSDKMAAQINNKLKTAISGAVGAGAGLALATAINGATQLNELAGEYQVQTGASAEQAKAFSNTLNDLYANAHQSYEEIAQTLIGLKTHFDMDGVAAKALSSTVLDFAEIAGGTGADAVERLNSLVKTGVIAQGDMSATMDKLTLAHQKWGININETLDSLVKFAPAMNALGMSTDDAIGWMSMFNKAGVDSQRVTMGFDTAIKKVKTPEEFKALVAQIASTPDDFERARLASDLFGTRAGSALANMLRPGSESVADMAKLIGTDYTGAVSTAAKANDSTFSGTALLMVHKFQAELAGLGSIMGDNLVIFAMFGPQLTKALGAGIGAVSGIFGAKVVGGIVESTPAVVAAATAQGAEAGAAEGTAMGAGAGTGMVSKFKSILASPMGLIGVALVAAGLAYTAVEAWAAQRSQEISTDTAKKASIATDEQIQATIDALKAAQAKVPTLLGWDVFSAKNLYQDQITTLEAEQHARKVAADIADGKPTIDNAIKHALSGIEPTVEEAAATATFLAALIPGNIAKGIADKRSTLDDGWAGLVEGLKHQITPAAEASNLIGKLVSKTMADGLQSGDPEVQAKAQQISMDAIARLAELGVPMDKIGKSAMDVLAAGLHSKNPVIKAQAEKTMAVLTGAMGSKADGGPAAEQVTDTMLAKFKAEETLKLLASAGGTLLQAFLGGFSGKGTVTLTVGAGKSSSKGGPGDESSGTPAPNSKALGFASGTDYVPYSGVFKVGEKGSEDVWLPQGAKVVPHDQIGSGPGGGQTNHLYFGDVHPRTVEDAARTMRRLSVVGAIG